MNDPEQQRNQMEISSELITCSSEMGNNWLVMISLSQYVTRIASHAAFSHLARGISSTNLTRWYRTLIVNVSGHEVRQDTATFILGLTLMDITSEACWSPCAVFIQRMCEPNCSPLQFSQPGTSQKRLFLMNPHILRINILICS